LNWHNKTTEFDEMKRCKFVDGGVKLSTLTWGDTKYFNNFLLNERCDLFKL